MLSPESLVDVTLGLWKHVGLTNFRGVLFSEILGLVSCRQLRFSQWAESRNVLWIVAVVISM